MILPPTQKNLQSSSCGVWFWSSVFAICSSMFLKQALTHCYFRFLILTSSFKCNERKHTLKPWRKLGRGAALIHQTLILLLTVSLSLILSQGSALRKLRKPSFEFSYSYYYVGWLHLNIFIKGKYFLGSHGETNRMPKSRNNGGPEPSQLQLRQLKSLRPLLPLRLRSLGPRLPSPLRRPWTIPSQPWQDCKELQLQYVGVGLPRTSALAWRKRSHLSQHWRSWIRRALVLSVPS